VFEGGNTFYLLKAVRESGFENIIKAHYAPEMKAMLEVKAKDVQCKIRALNDDQAILVCNGKVQLLGGGDEIIL